MTQFTESGRANRNEQCRSRPYATCEILESGPDEFLTRIVVMLHVTQYIRLFRYFRDSNLNDDLDRVADPLGQLLSRWMATEKPNEFRGVGGIRTDPRHPR